MNWITDVLCPLLIVGCILNSIRLVHKEATRAEQLERDLAEATRLSEARADALDLIQIEYKRLMVENAQLKQRVASTTDQ